MRGPGQRLSKPISFFANYFYSSRHHLPRVLEVVLCLSMTTHTHPPSLPANASWGWVLCSSMTAHGQLCLFTTTTATFAKARPAQLGNNVTYKLTGCPLLSMTSPAPINSDDNCDAEKPTA